ncbi:MAG: BatD family protein, partial [Candidatus Edwardsbacteria bacterium]|nr:BatD family protein [Candidatus Edwardsbacteria bacterium]
MNRIFTYISLFSLLSASGVAAAEISFTASVDQSTVGLGDELRLNLTVSGENISSVPKPEMPAMPDFNILSSTTSQSTNIQIINSQMKKQATINFIYVLSAKKLDKALIPACKLSYDGREYQSQPIEIQVVKTSQAQVQPQQRSPGMPAREAGIPVEGNLFLAASVDQRTIYIGEQVTLEYTFYNRFQLGNVNVAEMPSFGGFWTEKIYDANKLNFTQKAVNGKQYNVCLLKKVALFPMSSGDLAVKPMALNVAVVQPPHNFFDMFGTTQNVKIESKPLTITVLPLPEGKPKEFSGGVGQFTVSSSLDRTATSNNEPFNLTIKISGTGNIRLIEKPVIPAIPGLKILDPEVKEDIRASGDVIKGSKTFRYPIIPQTNGRYIIPAITLAYFDPQSKSYKNISTEKYECSATGCTQSAPLVEATGLKVLGTDINYIKPDAKTLKAYSFDPARWPALVYILSLGLIAASFFYRGYRERLATDRGFARKARS